LSGGQIPEGVSLNFFGGSELGCRPVLTTKKRKTLHPFRDLAWIS
jgi:hypothetical protein